MVDTSEQARSINLIHQLTYRFSSLSPTVTPSEQAAIRSTIERQIAALQQDDAVAAFAFASSEIQAQFITPENFLRMVQTGYAPVYRPRAVLFQEITSVEGLPAQKVMLMSQEGELVMALYLMQRQADASWRIHGCFLVPVEVQNH